MNIDYDYESKLSGEIENLLKTMYKMSQDENWSESREQELILDGGQLWKRYSKV